MRPVTNRSKVVGAITRSALVLAIAATPSAYVRAQSTAPAQPTAAECAALIRQAQNDATRKRMTKEQLDRTTVCLNLLKSSPPAQSPTTPGAPIRIFRD